MYEFDALRLYMRLVPWFLRKPLFMAWLEVLASVLQFIQGLLLAFVNETTYSMLFNSQVIYLEYILNDVFDSDPPIYIENVFLPPMYVYNTVEAQPSLYFRNESEAADPVYMYNHEEYFSAVQYIVHVSASLSGQENEIAALIDLYNLAGISYIIVFDL